jgi:lipoprotein-anchoring transpeptidase ErfK/SrfK
MRLTGVRKLALTAIAAAAVLALTGCGELGATNPRLKAISATEPPPVPTVTQSAAQEPVPPPAAPDPAACPVGDYLTVVEQALAQIGNYGHIGMDAVPSAQDCATIIAFQTRMGIEPANGQSDATTADVAQRIAATDPSQCPYSDVPQACVDLTHQTFYITNQGTVVLGPTVTRTGKPGYATPSGDFRIMGRSLSEWSTPFSVWLPYWQNFYMGDGLHETTTYIHNMPVGSHGCVNLLHQDAVAAYGLLTTGSVVHLYGRRPGT